VDYIFLVLIPILGLFAEGLPVRRENEYENENENDCTPGVL